MSKLSSASARTLILVADDDPLIVATLGHVLRAANFRVTEAFDSEGALDACMNDAPALAVIDYAMPGVNGAELARLIAAKTRVPLMFLSACDDEAIMCDTIAAGAMSYMVKPVDTLQVVPAVRTALQRSRELTALRSQTDQLSSALQMGRNISIATGLLMGKFQIGQQEAFERLRRYSRSKRTRLDVLASELLRANDEAAKMYEALSHTGRGDRDIQ